MEVSIFKKVLYGIAPEVGASLGKVISPEVIPNFLACQIETRKFSLYILCSENNDWAFVEDYDPESCELIFINNELISSKLKDIYNIKTLTKEELNLPFKATNSMLESDIKYWRPKTMGEGLFNWWD
ncbi:hypothetical protein Misp06_02538 [Microbulbifer sp. NBRC 101763]|uniref:hypothetical protein n=1 Tax=Microbulbifer sp. NBRC 101763 TaxID=1113820 RepID=UPI0030AD0467